MQLKVPEPLFIGILDNPDSRSLSDTIPVNELREVFAFLRENCKPNVVGDFNMPDTNWATYQSGDNYEQQVLAFIEDFGLIQMVNFETTKSSCLDLVLVTKESFIGVIAEEAGMEGFSNHFPLTFELTINAQVTKMSKSQYYSYCRCDYDSLLAEMAVQPFRPFCYSNVNVNLWYHWIYSMVDKYTPKRTKKHRNTTHGYEMKHHTC